MGISKSDIYDVARVVKTLLQSDETKSYLHGLLFDFYSDFVPADGEIPGIPRAVINESLIREQTKEIEKLNREKKPTEEDIERKRELQSEIQDIQEVVSQQGETVAHKGGRAKGLIPDLIVETIEQKATVVLAYYYHWLVKHENTDEEIEQLHEEWPKSKPPPVPPDAEEIPIPTAIGFQFFVDECSEVPKISPKGHQRVEKWATEVAEACADANKIAEPDTPRSTDEPKGIIFSADGSSVRWDNGKEYTFGGATQKVCVRIMYEALQSGAKKLNQVHILTEASSHMNVPRLRPTFQTGKTMHPFWEEVIDTDGSGNYWLVRGGKSQ